MVTRLYSHPIYLEHITPPGHPERPDRLRAIERVLEDEKFAALDRVQAPEGDPATILYAHPQSFVDKVQALIPETGIQRVDADTTVSPKSWQAAITAIGAANAAVDDVFSGRADNVFVASRPPGHHAEKTTAMGFCLFNNAAVAARAAQAMYHVDRVLIIDWDVHHGNGTQDIFYDDPRVYYLSIHLAGHYPGTGWIDERGAGAGQGTTRNVPLAQGTPAADTLHAFDAALSATLAEFEPQLTIVSAGFDCLKGDPLGGLLLEPADLHTITGTITERVGSPAVLVLEGGYAPARVAQGVLAVFHALAGLPH